MDEQTRDEHGRAGASSSDGESHEAQLALVHEVREGFGAKIKRVVGKVPFALDATAMYFALVDVRTPFWVKATLATTLAYFISPLDMVPDFLPISGYADDASMIYAALAVLHGHITSEHERQARSFLALPEAAAVSDRGRA